MFGLLSFKDVSKHILRLCQCQKSLGQDKSLLDGNFGVRYFVVIGQMTNGAFLNYPETNHQDPRGYGRMINVCEDIQNRPDEKSPF